MNNDNYFTGKWTKGYLIKPYNNIWYIDVLKGTATFRNEAISIIDGLIGRGKLQAK